jgi:hypothetical protein
MARARVQRSRAHHPSAAPVRPAPAARAVDDIAVLDVVEHLLRTRGWCQGRPQDRSGRLSLDGAVEEAAATLARTERERLVLAARSRNRLTRCAGAGALAAWNDRPERNQGEINELIAIARFLSS